MGNSCSLENVHRRDKFFIGDAVSKKIITRDTTSRGTLIDIKITLPAKTPRRAGQRSKPITHSCRLNADVPGLVIKGSSFSNVELARSQSADIMMEYENALGVKLSQVSIGDNKATQLLLVPQPQLKRWWVVPARQPFTRHSGTCLVIGDRFSQGGLQQIRVGDFIRFGSVGLLVTETHNGTDHVSLTERELESLSRDCQGIPEELFDGKEIHTWDDDDPRIAKQYGDQFDSCLATVDHDPCVDLESASDSDGSEGPIERVKDLTKNPLTASEGAVAPQCYMCFDGEENPEEDPLVAPCDCKGATKYVHVHCLQKWHASKARHKACIISNQKGAQVCGVCKAAYKTHRRLQNGDFVPLLRPQLRPPFISLSVCTRHQHQEELFSTRFHLSFGSIVNRSGTICQRPLVIGRSQACDMVLQYRTVSTHHASVSFVNGGFYIQDLKSSNGSYLYVREPLSVLHGETLRLRWGKGTISIKPPKPSKPYVYSSNSQGAINPCTHTNIHTDDFERLLNRLVLALPATPKAHDVNLDDSVADIEVSE